MGCVKQHQEHDALSCPQIQAQLFDSIVLPALTYGSEVWTFTQALSERVRVTHAALERRLVGISLSEQRQRNLHREEIRTQSEVLSLPVICPSDFNGCQWTGQLGSLHDHLTTCQYGLSSKCDLCGRQFSFNDLKRHREKCAIHRTVCSFCNKTLRETDLDRHLKLLPSVITDVGIARPMNSLHDTDAWIREDHLVRIESLWQSSRRQTQKHKNLIF
uniref:TRAF-type domain-containing protein n=1 Tax=Caenorhabditis japonica TaxID=281687 RepID=A0A8R1HHU6_CAEJA